VTLASARDWLACRPNQVQPTVNFDKIGPTLARALADHDYREPTPVQTAVLASANEGRDLIVSAQTGSGKTVAYGLAIASDILDPAGRIEAPSAPVALIVAPTRELALQVERELVWLYAHTGARITACVGGMNPREERRRLLDGADIVVGTPGRLRDHIERNSLILDQLAAVVLDEADEMLDLGFREDLEFILEATRQERRTLLFSATIPRGIAALAKRYQRDALRIEVAAGERGHADIEYRAIRVAPKEHEHVVVNLLRLVDAQTAIVFSNTREAVRHMQATLQERGFNSVLLSGELSQHERNLSMQALRDGRARVCVATDVAARGIDLPNLGLVIHAELPHDAETLQHRSGRTGRAGNKGISAILVPPHRRKKVEFMLRDAGVRAQWSGPPTAEEIRKLDRERLMRDPVFEQTPDEEDFELARMMLAERTPEQLCAALVRFYRSRLPAIEDVSDPGDGPDRREPRDARTAPPREFKSQKDRSLSDGVWFRLEIGRSKNADPKWLLPMLCRKGNITRQDIGAIRIFDNETKVEIASAVAKEFAVNIRKPGGENIRVDRIDGDDGRESARTPAPRREARKPDSAASTSYSARKGGRVEDEDRKQASWQKGEATQGGDKYPARKPERSRSDKVQSDTPPPAHLQPKPKPKQDGPKYDWSKHKGARGEKKKGKRNPA
jgi:ATP-dependent RNA helicase DeaD